MRQDVLAALAVSLLLTACGSQPDSAASDATANGTAPATVEAQPGGGAAEGPVYPGSRTASAPDRFSTGDPIDQVLAWYWDEDQPMRQRNGQMWAVSKPERRDDGYLVQLTIVGGEDGQSYAIYLNPRADGGTDGRVRPITDEELKSGVKL